jgi:hypothetical protein
MLGLASQASSPGPFHKGKPAQLTPFFICIWDRQHDVHPFFLKKIDDVSPILPRFRLLWWPENQGLYFFTQRPLFQHVFFYLKYL